MIHRQFYSNQRRGSFNNNVLIAQERRQRQGREVTQSNEQITKIMIVYILLIHNLTNWSSCAGHAGSIGFHGDNPPVLSVLYAWMANGGIVSGLVLSLSSPAFCLEESMTEKFWHLSACCLLCVVYVLCWQFSHNQ